MTMLSYSHAVDLQLWLMPIPTAPLEPTETLLKKLGPATRGVLDNLPTHGKRKQEFLLGRLLLNHALAQSWKAAEQGVKLIERKNLPPEIPDLEQRGLRFSISHSKNMIAIVLSDQEGNCPKDLKLGLDIEHIRPVRDFATIDFFCNKQQIQQLKQIGDLDVKTALYYQLWTQKEACLKAKQTGITDPALKQLGFQASEALASTEFNSAQVLCAKYQPASENADENYQVSIYCNQPFSIKTHYSDWQKNHISSAEKSQLNWQSFEKITEKHSSKD